MRLWVLTLFVVVMSLTAVSLSAVSLFGTLNEVCSGQRRDWDAWQRVIEKTQHPPGFSVTKVQQERLDQYAEILRDAVGKRPAC